MSGFEEQRKHSRAPTRCMIRYRHPKESDIRKSELSTARDLSEGGARFTSGNPFKVGDHLELEITCPRFPDPISVKAEIRWQRELRKGFLYENGVQFLNLSPEDQEVLGKIVDFILKQSP